MSNAFQCYAKGNNYVMNMGTNHLCLYWEQLYSIVISFWNALATRHSIWSPWPWKQCCDFPTIKVHKNGWSDSSKLCFCSATLLHSSTGLILTSPTMEKMLFSIVRNSLFWNERNIVGSWCTSLGTNVRAFPDQKIMQYISLDRAAGGKNLTMLKWVLIETGICLIRSWIDRDS